MHENEVVVSLTLVQQLIQSQFPQWANLSISPIESFGSSHVIFRLGDDKVIRLPRTEGPVSQISKEHMWLPKLAPHLPLSIPVPLAQGEPDMGYPFPWSIASWMEGNTFSLERLKEPEESVNTLAHLLLSLQQLDTTDGPLAGEHNFFRGVPLALRDSGVRQAINELKGMIDTPLATQAWEHALNTPIWDKDPLWIHGDLIAGNVIVNAGRVSAIIDFGGMALGDPACDLMVAWTLLNAEMRQVFKNVLKPDPHTWSRGRGWALCFGLVALPYYKDSNPVLANSARQAINEALMDVCE